MRAAFTLGSGLCSLSVMPAFYHGSRVGRNNLRVKVNHYRNIFGVAGISSIQSYHINLDKPPVSLALLDREHLVSIDRPLNHLLDPRRPAHL
jgi:hypothetical protein